MSDRYRIRGEGAVYEIVDVLGRADRMHTLCREMLGFMVVNIKRSARDWIPAAELAVLDKLVAKWEAEYDAIAEAVKDD